MGIQWSPFWNPDIFSPILCSTLPLSYIYLFIHSFILSNIQHSLTTYHLLSVLRWHHGYLLLICLPWATLISKCVKFTQSLQQSPKFRADICLSSYRERKWSSESFNTLQKTTLVRGVNCESGHSPSCVIPWLKYRAWLLWQNCSFLVEKTYKWYNKNSYNGWECHGE